MRRILLVVLAAVLTAVGSVAAVQPAVAGTTGSISGQVHRAVSTDLENMRVFAYRQSGGSWVSAGSTDVVGALYSFPALTPGTYTLRFIDLNDNAAWAPQYWSNKPTLAQAQSFTLAADQSLTKDATLAIGATLVAHVVMGAAKTPAAGAYLTTQYLNASGSESIGKNGTADANGDVVIHGMPTGGYTIATGLSGYSTEGWSDWGPGYPSDTYFLSGSNTGQTAYVWLRTDVAPGSTFFQDVPDSSSFATAINWMARASISTGTPVQYERPLYKPTDPVSRQAMALFLFRFVDMTTPILFDAPADPTFADVPASSSFYSEIEWMADRDISTGTPQPSGKPLYKPLDAVSRQAMALFLQRVSGAVDGFVPPATPSFADVPTSSTFYAAIEWMKATGLSTGTPQPSGKPLYKPSDPVSRQAMAVFLYALAADG